MKECISIISGTFEGVISFRKNIYKFKDTEEKTYTTFKTRKGFEAFIFCTIILNFKDKLYFCVKNTDLAICIKDIKDYEYIKSLITSLTEFLHDFPIEELYTDTDTEE